MSRLHARFEVLHDPKGAGFVLGRSNTPGMSYVHADDIDGAVIAGISEIVSLAPRSQDVQVALPSGEKAVYRLTVS